MVYIHKAINAPTPLKVHNNTPECHTAPPQQQLIQGVLSNTLFLTVYTTPLYVGSSLTLTYTVTLDPNVDNDENVTASWSGPSDITGEKYLVTAASGSGSTYTAISLSLL